MTPMVEPVATLRERFRGTLLGLAAGDALGAPAEFLTPEQVAERWGVLSEITKLSIRWTM